MTSMTGTGHASSCPHKNPHHAVFGDSYHLGSVCFFRRRCVRP